MIALNRGQPYPLAVSSNDGAEAVFLTRGGSVLKIRINGMTGEEERGLRYGTLKAGLLVEGVALLWLFEFFDEKGPLFTFDAPFDVRAIPVDDRELPSTASGTESRLLIQVHAVDEAGILRGIRGVSLSPGVTRKFLAAVMDQLVATDSGAEQHRRWRSVEPVDLARLTPMELCGRS